MAVVKRVWGMTPDVAKERQGASQRQLNDALGALLASTRRTKRKLNLLEVCHKAKVARDALGSIHALAQAIGLSDEMVRQFLRVEKLAPEVKRLVAGGKITGVDVADRISRLPAPDQLPVARLVASRELDFQDVRAILSFRRTAPQVPIGKVIDRIKKSRSIKEYIAEFVVPQGGSKPVAMLSKLASVLGRRNILFLKTDGQIGRIVITADGRKTLLNKAKALRLSKGELIKRIIAGEVP